jgi:hypothetical protein
MFCPGALICRLNNSNTSLGTDTIFSSQIFHLQETGAVRQNHSPCQRRATTVVKVVVASAMTMAEGRCDCEVEQRRMRQYAGVAASLASVGVGVGDSDCDGDKG